MPNPGAYVTHNRDVVNSLHTSWFFYFQTSNSQLTESSDITWGNLADLAQLPQELQKALSNFFHIWSSNPQDL